MRKLMVLAALLAVVALAAIPAIAQVSQESEQEGESGELDQSFTVTSSGDNSNQCVGIQGVGNTGNAQTLTNVLQYGSTADEFEFEENGSSIDVSPANSTECTSQVNQAASASG
jgi:Tfp pilus assembly protein FimT